MSQTASKGSGPGSFVAIPAGDLKIPDPIVDPTRIATAVQRPILRGSPSGEPAAAEFSSGFELSAPVVAP
jgi:hypothetical protein